MEFFDQLEAQLYERSFIPWRRWQAAQRVALTADVWAATILAKALVQSRDRGVRAVARKALQTWAHETVLLGLTLAWVETDNPTLAQLLVANEQTATITLTARPTTRDSEAQRIARLTAVSLNEDHHIQERHYRRAAAMLAATDTVDAVNALLRVMADGDERAKQFAYSSLFDCSPTVVVPVVMPLWHERHDVRLCALLAAKQIEAAAPHADLGAIGQSLAFSGQENWLDKGRWSSNWETSIDMTFAKTHMLTVTLDEATSLADELYTRLWNLCAVIPPAQSLSILSHFAETEFEPADNVSLYRALCAFAHQYRLLHRPWRWKASKTLLVDCNQHGPVMQFSADGGYLVSGHAGKMLWWNVPQGHLLARVDLAKVGGTQLCVDASHAQMWATCGGDSAIACYSAESPQTPQHTLYHNAQSVTAFAVAADGNTVVHGDHEGAIHVWDVVQSTCTSRRWTGVGPVSSLAISASGTWLASAHATHILLWDVPTMTVVATIQTDSMIDEIVLSPDSQTLVVCPDGVGVASAYDGLSGALRWKADRTHYHSATITPDNEAVVFCTSRRLEWRQLSSGTLRATTPLVSDQVRFHPQQRIWATGRAHEPWIHIWSESELFAALHRPVADLTPAVFAAIAQEADGGIVKTGHVTAGARADWVRYCQMLASLAGIRESVGE